MIYKISFLKYTFILLLMLGALVIICNTAQALDLEAETRITPTLCKKILEIDHPNLVLGGGSLGSMKSAWKQTANPRFQEGSYVILDNHVGAGSAPWLQLDFNNLEHLGLLAETFPSHFDCIFFDSGVESYVKEWTEAHLFYIQALLTPEGRFYLPLSANKLILGKKEKNKRFIEAVHTEAYVLATDREHFCHILTSLHLDAATDSSAEIEFHDTLVTAQKEGEVGISFLHYPYWTVKLEGIATLPFLSTASQRFKRIEKRNDSSLLAALRKTNEYALDYYDEANKERLQHIFGGAYLHRGSVGPRDYPDLLEKRRNDGIHNGLYWVCGQGVTPPSLDSKMVTSTGDSAQAAQAGEAA